MNLRIEYEPLYFTATATLRFCSGVNNRFPIWKPKFWSRWEACCIFVHNTPGRVSARSSIFLRRGAKSIVMVTFNRVCVCKYFTLHGSLHSFSNKNISHVLALNFMRIHHSLVIAYVQWQCGMCWLNNEFIQLDFACFLRQPHVSYYLL